MNILTINGSMRKNKNTFEICEALVKLMIESNDNIHNETIYIADMDIANCKVHCSGYCIKEKYKCCIDDDFSIILDRMINADALIIGAPLYFRAPPAKFHTFAERMISMFFYNENQSEERSPLYGKPCALIGLTQYSSPTQILEYLNDFAHLLKMEPVSLKQFPYLGIGGQGDIHNDQIFSPFECAKEMAESLVGAVRANMR